MRRLILLLACSACAAGPDEFSVTYGRAFNGDSTLEGWPITQEDTDYVGLGLTWALKPRQVEFAPTPRAVAVEDLSVAIAEAQEVQAQVREDELAGIGQAIRAWSAMDVVSRILSAGFFGLLVFIFREPLKAMISRGKP